jgi:hypothetical protein
MGRWQQQDTTIERSKTCHICLFISTSPTTCIVANRKVRAYASLKKRLNIRMSFDIDIW